MKPYFHCTRDGLIALFIGAVLLVVAFGFGYICGPH